jgi:hypothetical protein
VDVGDYELWVEYDAVNLQGFGLAPYLTPIKAQSNHVRFRIIAPTGLDAEVFAKYSDPCNRMPQYYLELLNSYPTSTYAGYMLGNATAFNVGFGLRTDYLINVLIKDDFVQRHPIASVPKLVKKDGKTDEVFDHVPMGQQLQSSRQQIDTFLVLHPGFALRDRLEAVRACESLALHDEAAAVSSLEWLSKNASEEQWKAQADAILDELSKVKKAQTPQSKEQPKG